MSNTQNTDAIEYADYILNHYSRDSHADKLCLASDLERHGWTKNKVDAHEVDAKIIREHDQANEHLSAARYFLEKYITEADEARQLARWLYQRLKQVCLDHPLYGNVDGILARLKEAQIDNPWLENSQTKQT